MDDGLFWILVFPILLLAVLYYLGILTLGLGFLKAATKVKTSRTKLVLLLTGVAVLTSPFALKAHKTNMAEIEADNLQAELAALERVSLKGRMPGRFVTVGNISKSSVDFIQNKYPVRQVSAAEHQRLATAYRNYRKAEFCHKYFYKERIAPNINISTCRSMPDSLQKAMALKRPLLIFAEGSNVSLRRSNTIVGKMYEIRLVTPKEDLLVDYYEQRTLDDPVSITNPYTSGRKRDPSAPTLRFTTFVETALSRAMHE